MPRPKKQTLLVEDVVELIDFISNKSNFTNVHFTDEYINSLQTDITDYIAAFPEEERINIINALHFLAQIFVYVTRSL